MENRVLGLNRTFSYALIIILVPLLLTIITNEKAYADTTIFEDNFNIVAESTPKWAVCGIAASFDTVLFFEGNASIKSTAFDNSIGTTDPLYHNVTGMNTLNGNYNLTVMMYLDNDMSVFGIDLTSPKCDFVITSMIGRRSTESIFNISYTFGGGGWVVTDIPIVVHWAKVTHIIGNINATHDFITLYYDDIFIKNATFSTVLSMSIDLHDPYAPAGNPANRFDALTLTQAGNASSFATSGYIGGVPSNSNFTILGGNSYIYVANVQRGIMINNTYFTVLQYINTFGDAWAAVTLYTAPNDQPISRLNPLKAMWSDFIVIVNGTTNLDIIFIPNIITLDNQFIAIALSVSEDMIVNASNTNQTMYTYPVYAPYSIDYLIPDGDKLGIRFTWNMIIPSIIADNIDLSDADNTFDLLNSMNGLAVRLGFPAIFVYGGLFMVVLMGTLIMIGNVKKEAGDTSKLPPIIFGTFTFSILAFFSITNMLPFELLIFAILGISAISGLIITQIILGRGD